MSSALLSTPEVLPLGLGVDLILPRFNNVNLMRIAQELGARTSRA